MVERSRMSEPPDEIKETAHSPVQELFIILGSAVHSNKAMADPEIISIHGDKVKVRLKCMFRINRDAKDVGEALDLLCFNPELIGRSLVIEGLFEITELNDALSTVKEFDRFKVELQAAAEKKEFSKEKLSDLIRTDLMEAQDRQNALIRIKRTLFKIEEYFDTEYRDLVIDFKLITEEQCGQLDLIHKIPDHLVTQVSDEIEGFSVESSQGKKQRLTDLALSTPPDPTGKIQVIDFTQGDISYRTAQVFFPEIDSERNVMIDVYCCVPVDGGLN